MMKLMLGMVVIIVMVVVKMVNRKKETLVSNMHSQTGTIVARVYEVKEAGSKYFEVRIEGQQFPMTFKDREQAREYAQNYTLSYWK